MQYPNLIGGAFMRKRSRIIIITLSVIAAIAAIFIYPQQIRKGVSDGLILCAEVVIPSMFIFAVVANFAAESGAAELISKPFSVALSPLLKIPKSAAYAVIMSFFSGYPVGAAGVARLFNDGKIDKPTAERMLAFCSNASPTMVIIAIGSGLLGDMSIGWIIYLSHIAASLLIGAVFALFTTKSSITTNPTSIQKKSIAEAFTVSTADACNQMLIICAYVVLFCAVGEILRDRLPIALAVLEVTSGAKWAADKGASAPIIAGITAFGGISVICQIMSVARKITSTAVVFFERVANGIITAAICTAAMKLINKSTEVISNLGEATARFGVVTVPVTLSMLIMAATFLAAIRPKNLK